MRPEDIEKLDENPDDENEKPLTRIELPAYADAVQAGFPSPAGDYIEKRLDLNELIVKHPAATFFVRAQGDSMIDAGIHSGDVLVVDRSLEVTNNKIVIAVVDGELTVKRYRVQKGKHYLVAENKNFRPIEIEPESDFRIWGVVTYVLHQTD